MSPLRRTSDKPGAADERPPWWALRQRARARARAWWLRRLPRTDTVTLTQRNIYILPTRSGWMLALTLAVLLVASINYQINLGYLLTFLLAGSAGAGMIAGHNALRGLALHLDAPSPFFAGGNACLQVHLINTARRPRWSIGLALKAKRLWSWADVPAGGQTTLLVSLRIDTRGWHAAPTLLVETRFPLGTFRVWAPWRPAARLLVYPAPELEAPPLPRGSPDEGDPTAAATAARSAGEFDGVRAYRAGDPLKLIVWKKFAKVGELVTRESVAAQSQALWLDYNRTGLGAPEQRLSRLTAWVLAADAGGLPYGLRLPGVELTPDLGASHRRRCLRALATC